MPNSKTMYEHTWYGQPAVWVEREERIRVRFPRERRQLWTSVQTIKAHQNRDAIATGLYSADGVRYDGYGYRRVEVPQ